MPVYGERERTLIAELLGKLECEPLTDRDKRGLDLAERFQVRAAERQVVDAMTAQQRLHAFWAGRFSVYQQDHWSSRFPGEVPMIDDVPIFLAATLDVSARR